MLEPSILDPRIEPVEGWRLEKLIDAGYSVDDAVALAPRPDIDLHQAVELVDRGCSPELAARILL